MNEIETFHGPIENTADALRVFELCRQGRLGRVRRRLHEKERRLIRSGSVFVFDEQESGIRRWTDGRLWSPSRILGNFLIYRELERRVGGVDSRLKRLQPAEATTDSIESNYDSMIPWLTNPVLPSSVDDTRPIDPISSVDPSQVIDSRSMSMTSYASSSSEGCANSLLGPNSFRLLKSKKLQAAGAAHGGNTKYIFRPDGLIKKTISAKVDGRMQHLVCYFSEADFIVSHSGRHGKVTQLLEELRRTRIPADLVLQQNFRKQPTTELGFPLVDVAARKRRHSMGVVGAPSMAEISIYPRGRVDSMAALDLASNWNSDSPSTDETALLPDPSELDPILGVLGNDVPPPDTIQPSTNNIMEECIRMVLGDPNEACVTPGLCFSSEDPTLPIVERPDSEAPFQ